MQIQIQNIALKIVPFGSPMVGRDFSSADYRFGFNGKEKDDEVTNAGKNYDFGNRILRTDLGKWLSIDKLQARFPSDGAYNQNGDNPILFVDPDGKKKTVYITLIDENGKVTKTSVVNDKIVKIYPKWVRDSDDGLELHLTHDVYQEMTIDLKSHTIKSSKETYADGNSQSWWQDGVHEAKTYGQEGGWYLASGSGGPLPETDKSKHTEYMEKAGDLISAAGIANSANGIEQGIFSPDASTLEKVHSAIEFIQSCQEIGEGIADAQEGAHEESTKKKIEDKQEKKADKKIESAHCDLCNENDEVDANGNVSHNKTNKPAQDTIGNHGEKATGARATKHEKPQTVEHARRQGEKNRNR